jgi:hypothetical protein
LQRALDFKFLADESFSFAITSILKKIGYDIKCIGDMAAGVSDREKGVIEKKGSYKKKKLADNKEKGDIQEKRKKS